ncbi:ATP-dependent RNA helicase HrpA [Idiomarina tyrosinivorans]|uniref:ATP-dependent RNA helicase HrpA n=1 Tax=Idiomarina tyrosinivorans TaxID=1445662 RepID=UPI0018E54286|nr:ATP-dependent RNA helicase HrpA [Idiomarina tyrosinivorans]
MRKVERKVERKTEPETSLSLDQCSRADAAVLRARMRGSKKITDKARRDVVIAQIVEDAEQAQLRWQLRQQQHFHLEYPPQLPVSEQRQALLKTLREHQVVVIAGETGSGKTTQIPKMLLELGYGRNGMVGHTQPRRLAARSVCKRLQDELKDHYAEQVGYKVRFTDETGELTAIKLMTDGILLAELQRDPLLLQYDALVIDEAHERSLNIDFLLGVIHQILPKRPDLKVVITSATIETERFSKHFNDAPVVEVSGRTYPVEVRYRPLDNSTGAKRELTDAVNEAVLELQSEGPGDILLFASGEREIRDFADAIGDLTLPNTEILPLYSRLSTHEQNRIFQSSSARRIVIATNVAETSLTVPGIRYVIDPGTARISRYSYRTKVQRLPIEPVSQASANQRKGRCGRTAPGIAIRLYSEEDFEQRPEYTDPEILRTNLAAVILQMTALRLGDIRRFPFVQKPDERYIRDGLNLLEELNAIETGRKHKTVKLTQLGRQLASLPLDPRLGRMVLAAKDYGCMREIMVITAALSIQDPRERPQDMKQKADEQHQRFADKDSDFISFLKLWDYVKARQKALSGNQFRKQLGREFLHVMRLREWQDIYTQTRQTVRELGFAINQEPASYEAIHRALISGLLSQLGQKHDRHEYIGARQTHFHIFPGSQLFGKPPKWVLTAELVETSKLFARVNAAIEPEWVEREALHLVNRRYHNPRFEKKQGSVVADEQISLFGLVIVPKRRVQYGPIAAAEAREIFIREALVHAQLQRKLPFITHNLALIEEIQTLEDKSRRRDILIDEQELFNAYDSHIPDGIYNEKLLAGWWHKAVKSHPQCLYFTRDDLIGGDTSHVTEKDYPDHWQHGSIRLPLHYHFEPTAEDDGVTVEIPLALLNQVDATEFEWHIPALREEKLVGLIKSLPKQWRKNFVPAPNFAKALMDDLRPYDGELLSAMSAKLRRMTGVTIDEDAWDIQSLAPHLRMNFRIVDNQKVVAQGRDLSELQQRLSGKVKQRLEKSSQQSDWHKQAIERWDFGQLPEETRERHQGYEIRAYPALTVAKQALKIAIFDHPLKAQQAHREGVRALLLKEIPSPRKHLQKALSNKTKLAMYFNPWGKVDALIEDCIAAAVDLLVDYQQVRDGERYEAAKEHVRAELNDQVEAIASSVEQCLVIAQQVKKRLKGNVSLQQVQSHADMKAQLDGLIFPGFVVAHGAERLADIVRYLKALQRRQEKLRVDANKDRLHTLTLNELQQRYQALCEKQPKHLPLSDEVREIRWMIEELRVSFFAQTLGTRYPISEKRVKQALAEVSES